MALTLQQLAQAGDRLAQLNQSVLALPQVVIANYGRQAEHRQYQLRGKTFAYYCCDHHGDGRIGLWCKSTHAEQYHRVADEPQDYYVPAYLGKSGWLALRLDRPQVAWSAVQLLLRQAWLAQAPKSIQKLLDATDSV